MRKLSILLGALVLSSTSAAFGDDAMLERGKYLASIMDCGGCHTPVTPEMMPDQSRYLGGGTIGFDLGPLGIFWPPNLTSDETGLAAWSDEEIVTAITTGVRPDGRILAPVMPYMSYSALTPEDAKALVAYLRTIPHVANKVPDPVGEGQAAVAPYFSVKAPQ